MFYIMYLSMVYVLARLDRAIHKVGEKVGILVDREQELRRKSVSALHRGQKSKRACEDLAANIEAIGQKMLDTSKAKESELLRRANAVDLERKGLIHMQNHMAQVRNSIVDARNTARSMYPLAVRLGNLGRKLKFWK